jgi:hypothetical protein
MKCTVQRGVTTVTLTLSEKEAIALGVVCGAIGGNDTQKLIRPTTGKVYQLIKDKVCGGSWEALDYRHFGIKCDKTMRVD